MNMSEIEELIMTGVDHKAVGMRYAQGYGRLLGFLWGTIDRMSPEDKAEIRERLEGYAKFWSESQKKVEESTTYQ